MSDSKPGRRCRGRTIDHRPPPDACFLRPLRPYARALLAAAVASLLAFVPAARAADAPTVALAGSFNNWSAGDPEFQLRPEGSGFVLQRFWESGSHEFKFVFGGSWDRHLGAAADGSLVQPGANIRLIIPQTGFYVITLDEVNRRWSLEKRPPPRPRAVIRVHGARAGVNPVELDATASIARDARPLRSFSWQVLPLERGVKPSTVRIDDNESARTELTVPAAGRYEVRLTVNDGEQRDEQTHSALLGFGSVLEFAPIGEGGELAAAPRREPMLPMSDGRWAAAVPVASAAPHMLRVLPAAPPEGARILLESTIDLVPAPPPIIVYDTKANALALSDGDCAKLSWTPAGDGRLPDGLVVERVDLVGDFNAWRPGASPMFLLPGRSPFERLVSLPEGLYRYKFLVNGGLWLEDRDADPRYRTRDDAGGFASGLLIGEDATRFDPAEPNQIRRPALRHAPDREQYLAALSERMIDISLRTLAGDVEAADLIVGSPRAIVPMGRLDSRLGFDYWTARVAVESPSIEYGFQLRDGADSVTLDGGGVTTGVVKMPYRKRVAPAIVTPDWAKRAVWYQIFPERFRNGDSSNDPPSTVPWQHAWFKPFRPRKGRAGASAAAQSGYSERGNFYSYIYRRRYGGDLQGIREKLPYLRDLGVTAIYLNPIFQAESLHKYDASDFRHIDDSFGVRDSRLKLRGETTDPATWRWSETDRLFLDFLREAHAMGFRVIIDGVFNHVGRGFWAFQDVLKHGRKSPYGDWFDITSFEPFHYRAWDGDDGSLPRLKHDDALGLSEPVRQHLFAVTRRWMDPDGDGDPSDGVDGWRLDVAADINVHFWRDWRRLVKSINPDAYLVAEIWDEAREWLDGTTFDATMNYEFARRCQRFFVNRRKATIPSQFRDELRTMLGWYAPQVSLVLQNLFDSHDTDRVASMLMNPDLEYDHANRLQDSNPKYNTARPTAECYERVRLMTLFQMTFLGAPMIYYGDEVGMFGADDPSCRKPMLWEDLLPFDDPDEAIVPGLRDHFRRMIAIRNSSPALQLGLFEVLHVDDDKKIFAFCRRFGRESVVVVINNDDHPHRLNIPVPWPAGTSVLRLDDPAACQIDDPPASDPRARPTVRPVPGHRGDLVVADGRLRGIMLPPRSGAVFRPAGL